MWDNGLIKWLLLYLIQTTKQGRLQVWTHGTSQEIPSGADVLLELKGGVTDVTTANSGEILIFPSIATYL